MDKLKLEQLGIDISNLDLCTFLKYFSYETWDRIGFTRSYFGMRIYETTITQNLVYSLYSIARNTDLPLKIYESQDEASNGNDLEIFIKVNGGYMRFACQCKIIYKNNKYVALDHQRKGSQQIDALISYATKQRCIPLYMFYNHCTDNALYSRIKNIELYGCSIISAFYIKNIFFSTKWKIPHFKDIHPKPAKPFSDFVCDAIGLSADTIYQSLSLKLDNIRLYSFEEIDSDKKWADLTPPPSLGFINPKRVLESYNAVNEIVYKPKFRIILSNEKINKKTVDIYLLS